jgi:hypothetical protein
VAGSRGVRSKGQRKRHASTPRFTFIDFGLSALVILLPTPHFYLFNHLVGLHRAASVKIVGEARPGSRFCSEKATPGEPGHSYASTGVYFDGDCQTYWRSIDYVVPTPKSVSHRLHLFITSSKLGPVFRWD